MLALSGHYLCTRDQTTSIIIIINDPSYALSIIIIIIKVHTTGTGCTARMIVVVTFLFSVHKSTMVVEGLAQRQCAIYRKTAVKIIVE